VSQTVKKEAPNRVLKSEREAEVREKQNKEFCLFDKGGRKGKRGLVALAIIPALGRLRQEHCKFEASLSCITRPCLKQKRKKKRTRDLGWKCQENDNKET
jgi:hypothetical protein